jgi:hypothetical protein
VWGSIPVAIALIGWFWPKEKQREERPPKEVQERVARRRQAEQGGTA